MTGGKIRYSYAIGTVTTPDLAGGLVGSMSSYSGYTAEIIHSYATGLVNAPKRTAGLVGDKLAGNVISSYYDSETTGQSDDIGNGVPKTTAEMKQAATYIDWDMVNIWDITDSYPFLRN